MFIGIGNFKQILIKLGEKPGNHVKEINYKSPS
jgi:hypothetical protein